MFPAPWTLRELVHAATAKRRDAWDRAAELLALLAECNRDPNRRAQPFDALDFHPLRKRRKRRKPAGFGLDGRALEIVGAAVVGARPPWEPEGGAG